MSTKRPCLSISGPVVAGRTLALESLESRRLLAIDFDLLKDVNATQDSGGSYPAEIVAVGSTAFFTATTPQHGLELWKSDGTEAGTILVKDIRAGSLGSNILSYPPPSSWLTNVGGTLFFVANDGGTGTELWKSDGTEAGTVRVKDIRAGLDSSSPSLLTNVGGTLFFVAHDGVTGAELWKSDGTEAGTVLVKDTRPGLNGSSVIAPTNVGGTLYFGVNGSSEFECWAT